MTMQELKIFEEKQIRTVWDEVQEKWYFSIVDIVNVLTESKDHLTARKYWNKLKQRLLAEGNETVTNCHQLKMMSADGKQRNTDVADLEQMLRLTQSIPSPTAKPFKRCQSMSEHAQVAVRGGSVANSRLRKSRSTRRRMTSPHRRLSQLWLFIPAWS